MYRLLSGWKEDVKKKKNKNSQVKCARARETHREVLDAHTLKEYESNPQVHSPEF